MRNFELEDFKKWLQRHGVEILPPTNEYEDLRFKGQQIGILYKTGKTNSSYATKAKIAFIKNTKWNGGPIKTGRYKNYVKEKIFLIRRDGTRCFYCDQEMGEDITLEHLIALSKGGKNTLENMVLAHFDCNQRMNNKPISEKTQCAINNRKQSSLNIDVETFGHDTAAKIATIKGAATNLKIEGLSKQEKRTFIQAIITRANELQSIFDELYIKLKHNSHEQQKNH